MSKKKLSEYERTTAVQHYLQSGESQKVWAKRLGVGESTFRDWVVKYNTSGLDGLLSTDRKQYAPAIKKAAVLAYLHKEGSLTDICKRFGVKDRKSLRSWIKAYNGHDISSPQKAQERDPTMTKGRSTTLDERIHIVGYCLERNKNYADTAAHFSVSYQQVYSWVKKYEASGATALEDRRGKRKDITQMNEEEKLQAECRLLKARLKRTELENNVLKKLAAVERRGC